MIASLANGSASGGSGADTISGFEKLIGSRYADKLTAATEANTLDGGAGNDTLTGSEGDDTLIGGAGNDTFVVDAAVAATATGSVYGISDSAGTDTIKASATVNISTLTTIENITLTAGGLTATGNDLANTLTSKGFSGNTLVGGKGNDTYVVSDSNETVIEGTSAGTDTVQSSATFILADIDVENLTLTGSTDIDATGNGLANILIGNSGDNLLDGNSGIDKMSGGDGDDTYVVDSSTDIVTEVAGTTGTAAQKASFNGIDTVKSSTISITLGSNIEKLVLTGSSDINGTGNSLDNTLTGNDGANKLSGGTGNDAMSGGDGNDTYVVDSGSDTVTEAANKGDDTVQSIVTYTITDTDVEKLTLTGSSAINGTGNASANTLVGNTGNNTLDGGDGKDTLTGGTGADTFVYNAASESTVALFDVITDFTTGSDKIDVSAIFSGTVPGGLLTTAFTGDGNAEVLFTGGKVSFDVAGDGNADFAIALTGTSTAPVFGDFIF